MVQLGPLLEVSPGCTHKGYSLTSGSAGEACFQAPSHCCRIPLFAAVKLRPHAPAGCHLGAALNS